MTAELADEVRHRVPDQVDYLEHVVATELPVLFDERALDNQARTAIAGYVQRRRDWMAGVLYWHRMTRRYVESECVGPGYPPGRPLRVATLNKGSE